MQVTASTLEYSATLISNYFSACAPYVIPRVSWWGEAEIITFALKQFKALYEAGVAIDEIRLNEFLPLNYRTRLSSIY